MPHDDGGAYSMYCHGCGVSVIGADWEIAAGFIKFHSPHAPLIDAMQDRSVMAGLLQDIQEFLGGEKRDG